MRRSGKYATLRNLTFVFALIQIVWLVWFFYTGKGGGQELVAHVLPIALTLQILFMYQADYLYKWLPPAANHAIVALYIGICVYSFVYFYFEFERIAIYAQGSYTHGDFIVGLLMFLLVMELSRLAHPVLFWTNVVLVVYTLWGYLSPVDFFWHPGTIVLSRHHVEHGRTVDRHLRALRPARAHVDRGLPAARRRRERLRGAARDDQRGAHHRRTLAAAYSADRGRGVERDRHDQRLGLGQRRCGRHHHHPADDPLRRSRHVCRGGRDLGLDGRPDHAADDGGRRVPDVGISRRALLGRGGARLLARLRLLRFDRRRRLSAVRAAAAARSDRSAGRAALRQGQDDDLLLLGALPALPHGLCRQGRTDRRALHRDLHVCPAGRGVSLLQVRA